MLKLEIKFINIKNWGIIVNTSISINSISLAKLLMRYKLTSIVRQEIIKAAQKSSSTWIYLDRIPRKIEFKESNINHQQQ